MNRVGRSVFRCGLVAVAISFCVTTNVSAQSDVALRGFADLGTQSFAAESSFKAVLGSSRGVVFGGGIETLLPRGVFVSLRASRFRRTGERVFTFNDQTFKLGIPVTVTITPVELTGGYRVSSGSRLIPYAGGGRGWQHYDERSAFAEADDDVDDRFTGFHLLGGVELRLARWVGTAVDAQWTRVPNALGQNANGVSSGFGESDLGGVTYRIKVIIGP
jgi:opacity protein-like surface antigen